MAAVSVTILTENTARGFGLIGEHGFAAMVDVNGEKILFDTGAGQTLLTNARGMKIDLAQIKTVALSHGHYDHTGGLKDFLELHDGPVDVYAHSDLFSDRYSKMRDGSARYIGIDWPQAELEQAGAVFHLATGPQRAGQGLLLTGAIPRETPYETVPEQFQIKTAEGWKHDMIWDDQSLVIEAPSGLVVISGCAHAGVINTLKHVQAIGGQTKIQAFLGGTHLMGAGNPRIEATIEALRDLDVRLVGAGHCTGFEAAAVLYHELGDRFRPIPVGSVFEFD